MIKTLSNTIASDSTTLLLVRMVSLRFLFFYSLQLLHLQDPCQLPDDNEGGVAEAAHVDGGLQVGLGHGLGPEPAPALLLVLVAQLGQGVQERVAAARLYN